MPGFHSLAEESENLYVWFFIEGINNTIIGGFYLMNKQEYFNEAFKGYNVPANIRKISESICREFNIKGICDPMYISNVIAVELGLGDGCGNFSDNKPNLANINKLAERLMFSYGCNIDSLELTKSIIMRNVIKINISVLDGIKTQCYYADHRMAQYKIPYNLTQELKYLKNWMQERTEKEQEEFINYKYYVTLRWDQDGIINCMEVSARVGSFVNMSLSLENLENVINTVKEYNK